MYSFTTGSSLPIHVTSNCRFLIIRRSVPNGVMQKRSRCVTEESSDNFVYLRQWTYDVFIAFRTCLGFNEHLRTFNLVNDYLSLYRNHGAISMVIMYESHLLTRSLYRTRSEFFFSVHNKYVGTLTVIVLRCDQVVILSRCSCIN